MPSRAPLGVIIAGGLSRRMRRDGGAEHPMDKTLLDLGGRSLLQHVIARLGPQVCALALNSNGPDADYAGFGLPICPDTLPDHPGPLAGVLAGMEHAATQGASHIVTAAGDTPFLPCDLVPRLRLAAEESTSGVAVAASPAAQTADTLRLHPTFALWPVALRDELRENLRAGHRRMMRFAERHGAATAGFASPDGAPDPFFNINTPEDLQRARRWVARAAPTQ
ncbi:MAG: molybdenum cofactor guanylyltransferase MobA [Celeribacter sp.]